jgi:ABC-type nitrate/sulfonate/bicarbonate transport system substrate-binding protein
MTKRLMWLCVIAVAVLCYCGCTTKRSGNSETPTIRLSVAPFQDTLLPLVADRKGFFRDEGLNVEIKLLPWYSAQEAIAHGSVEIGMGNIASVVGAHQNFKDNVYVYGWNTFDNGFSIMVRPNSGFKTYDAFLKSSGDPKRAAIDCVKQLKGKRVITTGATDMGQVVSYAVRNAGMTFGKERSNDVRLVDQEPDEGLALFLSSQKSGDAYLGGIPQRTRLLKEGYVELIGGAALGPVEINGLVSTSEFMAAHKDAVLKLLHAMFRTIQYADQHQDETAQIIITELNKNTGGKMTPDDFKAFWQKVEHYTATPDEAQKRILDPTGDAYWRKRWDACNYYFQNEVAADQRISGPVDPTSVFLMEGIQRDYVAKYGAH